MYTAVVTRLRNVRPHPNADRVKLATCHGNQVVIGLDNTEDQMGIYFPSDGQLSPEFCKANNLYRDNTMNADPNEKPGMFDTNRKVRVQKFRGEKSDGFWMPLSCLDYMGKGYGSSLDEGYEFTELGDNRICNKFVNANTQKVARENQGKNTRKARRSVMFKEHFDTAHFGRNVHVFEKGQTIIITEKVHGTSHRVGYVQMERDLSWLERLAKRFGVRVNENEWKNLNGTRRVVIGERSQENAFHDPTIRDKAAKMFEGMLRKGETAYLEIVGFESTGAPIMPAAHTVKLGDKEFTKRYGELMNYSYGCEPGESAVYVYRMTFSNEDGQSVDYSWNDVVNRCNELGVKHVPHMMTLTLDDLEKQIALDKGIRPEEVDPRDLQDRFVELVETFGTGPSTLDPRHIMEGVCVRIEGGLNNRTFKFKNFEFKVLEQHQKDSGVVDAEEAQDTVTEEN